MTVALLLLLFFGPPTAGGAPSLRPGAPGATTAGQGPICRELFDDYRAVAPHFRHIQFFGHAGFFTNVRTTDEQRRSGVSRIDHFMAGPTDAVKRLAPAVTNYPYSILLTLPIPQFSRYKPGLNIDYNADMDSWYARHPEFTIESAFLHNPDGTRKSVKIWYTGPQDNRWVLNPADPGLRRYQADRLVRLMNGDGVPADGVFADELGPWALPKQYIGTREFPADRDAPVAALAELLAGIRKALGPGKTLMINTGDYVDPVHIRLIAAAGATHKELYNNPFRNSPQRWDKLDQILATGAIATLPSPFAQQAYERRQEFPPGNSPSTTERGRMWELASYYMSLTSPDRLWLVPRVNEWYRIYEANIGSPSERRSILAEGTDPVGQHYEIWRRPFTRALILVRPQLTDGGGRRNMAVQPRYDDATAVTVRLPGGPWRVLRMDGGTTQPVTSVTLRQAEGAILVSASCTGS